MQKETKLQEINKEAAIATSGALTKLIGRPVSVVISNPEVKDVKDLTPAIGAEEIVAGIYLPIAGDVQGAALLIFPKETTFSLSDLLVRRPPGTTRKLTELDKSALKEVGNIITGNYFTILGNKLQAKIIEHIPSFSFDMFGAILSEIITKFVQRCEKAIVIEVEFIFKPTTLTGHFLLLLEVEQIKAIMVETL